MHSLSITSQDNSRVSDGTGTGTSSSETVVTIPLGSIDSIPRSQLEQPQSTRNIVDSTCDSSAIIRLTVSEWQAFDSTSLTFHPVISHPTLTAVSEWRGYYLTMCLWIVFTMISAHLNIEVKGLQFAMMLLASFGVLCFLGVELTKMDRMVFGRLVQYFEYWLLLANLLVMLTCIPYSRIASDRALLSDAEWARVSAEPPMMTFSFFTFFISTWFSFSLDASVKTPPRVKTIILALLQVNLLYNYARDFWQPMPTLQFCFVICTNSRSLYLSSLLTILCFNCKYLLRSIRTPNALIIITPISFIHPAEGSSDPRTSDDELKRTDTIKLQDGNIPSDSVEMAHV